MPEAGGYDSLLKDLRAITDRPEGSAFNRENVLTLLRVLQNNLARPLAIPVETLDDGTLVLEEHPVMTLLCSLSSAINDLDAGLTDSVLRANSYGANNTRPWRLRAQDRALVDLVEVMQADNGDKNRNQTFQKLARLMKQGGYTRKGRTVDWIQMRRIYNKYKNQ